ncbi:MAG TPA: helix-turn-helix domain-containing protein [Chloroflexota bacterium]|nr:helix-turn-helix domain-containing protein [Chloroflexota bacterium]
MELLTVQETADLLRVSTVTVRRFIADGRLPAVKVGRAVRVDKADAEHIAKPVRVGARGKPSQSDTPSDEAASAVASLWRLVDLAGYDPDAPTDVAENKHKYLAEAYEDTHE